MLDGRTLALFFSVFPLTPVVPPSADAGATMALSVESTRRRPSASSAGSRCPPEPPLGLPKDTATTSSPAEIVPVALGAGLGVEWAQRAAEKPRGNLPRVRHSSMCLNGARRRVRVMTTFYDVPVDELIEAVTDTLEVEQPDWAAVTKTGSAREMAPQQDDFWQRRAASILRTVAVDGPVGVERLRTRYGGSKQGSNRYRVRPDRKIGGSGKIIRTILQQLEEAGYIETAEGEGRRVTGEGRRLLDETAEEVLEDLDRPELERYA